MAMGPLTPPAGIVVTLQSPFHLWEPVFQRAGDFPTETRVKIFQVFGVMARSPENKGRYNHEALQAAIDVVLMSERGELSPFGEAAKEYDEIMAAQELLK